MYGMDDDTIHEPKKHSFCRRMLPSRTCPDKNSKKIPKIWNENVLFTPPDVTWNVMNRQEIIVSKCFLNNKISHLFTSDPRRMVNLTFDASSERPFFRVGNSLTEHSMQFVANFITEWAPWGGKVSVSCIAFEMSQVSGVPIVSW